VGTLDLAAPAASSLTDGGVRLAQKRLARTPTRPDGGYDWSPDGRWLSVPAADTGSIMIVSPGGAPARRFELAGSGDVSDTAWSPTGDSVLATVRGAGDEFYRLKEVRVSDGHVETRAAPAFDVLRPLWIPGGSGYVYHVSQGARLAAVATDSCGAHRPFAQTLGGSAEVVGFSSRSREVLMIHRGEAAPPRLLAEPSCGGTPRELFRPDGAEGPRAVGPQDLVLRAADGVQVPAFLWQSPNPPVAGRVAVIGVHGGPHLQETPAWDAGVQWLVRQGIDVLRPNYRGSTHYGRRFERDDSVEGQVLDILAVRDHAMRVLGVEPGRIVLLGESHGATLVGHVLARAGARYGGVVLLSPVGAFPAGRAPGLYFSLAFHGRRDPLVTPDQAYAGLLSFFGETLRPPRGLWRVFPGEGHHFHRTGSWAEIYSVLLRRIRQLPAAHGVPDLQGLRRDPAPQRQSP
jgi:dipeptidyl aminopeptidase/acylaminoacyl peptidase